MIVRTALRNYAHFDIRVFASITSWVTWGRHKSLLRVPFCRLLFCYFRQFSCAMLTIVLTVLLCVFQLSASLTSSREDIGDIFCFLPTPNFTHQRVVRYPSAMTVNVTTFGYSFAKMGFDFCEMSPSDDGTLTLLQSRFRAQRGWTASREVYRSGSWSWPQLQSRHLVRRRRLLELVILLLPVERCRINFSVAVAEDAVMVTVPNMNE